MPWQPGQSGNPGGRPKGARDKLSKAVFEQMMSDWLDNGADVIEKVRMTKPEVYLQIISRMLPQNISIETDRRSVSELSSDELVAVLGPDKAA